MAFALKIGVVTDSHSDIDGVFGNGNDYASAGAKMTAFKNYMNGTFVPDLVIHTGDVTNTGVLGGSGADWDAVDDQFQAVTSADKYYAIGNHELDSPSTRSDFLTATGHSSTTYSFDKNGFHIIVLDTVYGDVDGGTTITDSKRYVTTADLSWLTSDLAGTSLPVVVFSHIVFDDPLAQAYFRVENRTSVRTILEDSGKTIIGCFGGHRHGNYNTTINGIDYYSLYSMVSGESPETAYSALTVYVDDGYYLVGIDNQTSYGTQQFETARVYLPNLPSFFIGF